MMGSRGWCDTRMDVDDGPGPGLWGRWRPPMGLIIGAGVVLIAPKDGEGVCFIRAALLSPAKQAVPSTLSPGTDSNYQLSSFSFLRSPSFIFAFVPVEYLLSTCLQNYPCLVLISNQSRQPLVAQLDTENRHS